MCGVALLSVVKQSDSHLWKESEKQYVCVCIYMYVFERIYIYIYICRFFSESEKGYIYACMYVYSDSFLFRIWERRYIYIYIYQNLRKDTHTHTYIYACIFRFFSFAGYYDIPSTPVCHTIGPRGLWILYIVVCICQPSPLLYPLSPSVAIIWASVPEGLFLSCK